MGHSVCFSPEHPALAVGSEKDRQAKLALVLQAKCSGLDFVILKSIKFGEEEWMGRKEGAGMGMHFKGSNLVV